MRRFLVRWLPLGLLGVVLGILAAVAGLDVPSMGVGMFAALLVYAWTEATL